MGNAAGERAQGFELLPAAKAALDDGFASDVPFDGDGLDEPAAGVEDGIDRQGQLADGRLGGPRRQVPGPGPPRLEGPPQPVLLFPVVDAEDVRERACRGFFGQKAVVAGKGAVGIEDAALGIENRQPLGALLEGLGSHLQASLARTSLSSCFRTAMTPPVPLST